MIGVAQFAEVAECDSVILQRRYPPGSEPPPSHPKIEYLQDMSGGRGRSDFTSWPAPTNPRARWGYAGGLGPANVDQAIEFTDEFESFRLWLDMESGIRTPDDWMDLDKATAVCRGRVHQPTPDQAAPATLIVERATPSPSNSASWVGCRSE